MLKSIKGVEIFSAGKWNGDVYTVEDLDEMVRAFSDTSAEWRPPLKLGHDEEQKLLQTDGLPAAGYVGKLYRQGTKLLADFVDIPAKVHKLLEKGSYKKVSSEIFWEIDVGSEEGKPRVYKRMLAAVALLGSDMPAVFGLDDILEWYVAAGAEKKFYANEKNKPSIKAYSFNAEAEQGDEVSSEEENSAMTKEEIEALKKKQADDEAELERLRKYEKTQKARAAEQENEIAELKAKAQEAELDAAVNGLTGEVSPAMKPYIKALLGPEKKAYSVKVAKGESKEYASKAALLEQTLKLHAEALKLHTSEETEDAEEDGDADESAIEKRVEEYQAKHKCSYGQAVKAVRAELAREQDDEEDFDDEDSDEDEE